MNEYLEKARNELKRSDHLVYVSLKYTRTCDVIHNTIQRLVNAYDFAILAVLDKAKSSGKIDSIPSSNRARADIVSKFKKNIKPYLKIYFLLIEITEADFDRVSEYRKGVTLISRISENKTINVDVPTLMSYFENAKEFVDVMEEWV
tara:strand:+ start:2972 stop:3412 length:441 start_codon:yes stop_codon:yes gene_type:complete